VVWAKAPGRFEAGTPAVVNAIAFARGLELTERLGQDCFRAAQASAEAVRIPPDDPLENLRGRELLAGLKAVRIGLGLRVPTAEGLSPLVNLDNAASTPTFAPVWEAVRRAWRLAPEARPALVKEAAAGVAGFLNAPPSTYEVLFTANTTEAINLAAENLGLQAAEGFEPVVLNTILEHNSNELPWRNRAGLTQVRLGAEPEGFLDPVGLEAELAAYNRDAQHGNRRVRLVAVTGASNVLGSFNDLEAVCRAAHRHGAQVLVDAAQLVAHRRVDMEACGIDFLAFSAHKAYAPFGSGALVAGRTLLAFDPARLERIRASGEENVGGLAGLAKALDLLGRIGLDLVQEEEQALTAQVLAGMARIPGLEMFGVTDAASPRFNRRGGVIAFQMKGAISYKLARELAERAGIGTRWGCHCAHLLIKHVHRIPPALQQFQRLLVLLIPRLELPGVARVSLGLGNEPADVAVLVKVLGELAQQGSAKRPEVRKRMDEFVEAAVQSVFGEG
jgi:selenocysteine lyase/cysteine desulfurase